jgi:hypothetical protein
MDYYVGSFLQSKEFSNVTPYTLADTIPYHSPLAHQIR